jgi:hypothetical protein
MDQDPQLDAVIGALAGQVFGRPPVVTKLPSEVNYVRRLHFGAPIPDKVIKVGVRLAASVLQEQQVLRRLWQHHVPVPPDEYTQDDIPAAPWSLLSCPSSATATWARPACNSSRGRWQPAAALARLPPTCTPAPAAC